MKHFIILFSLIFITSFSLYAQRGSRTTAPQKKSAVATKRTPTKQVSSTVYKPPRTTRNDNSEIKLNKTSQRPSRQTQTKAENQSRKTTHRTDGRTSSNAKYKGHRPSRIYNNTTINKGGNKKQKDIGINNYVKPAISKPKIHKQLPPSTGCSHNIEVVVLPPDVYHDCYFDYPVFLYESYQPRFEYQWAIYHSEDIPNKAYIEGEVVEVRYSRKTGKFVLHFGRLSPFQSATVVLSRKISERYKHNKRMIRKLRGEYVSISGRFSVYGNVPTIKVFDVEDMFVNNSPFIYFDY